jgi:peptidase E
VGKLIAIGGGPNGGDFDFVLENKIRGFLSRETPFILFIPYASQSFESNYVEFKEIYEKLGCKVDLLLPGYENKILEADMIYFGRGSTLELMSKLQETNAIENLIRSYEKGTTITGFSAGANILFSKSGSQEGDLGFILVEGLGLIKGCLCTHFNYDARAQSFMNLLSNINIPVIGLEDQSMIVVENDEAKIYTSNQLANGYRLLKKNNEMIKEKIKGNHSVLL